MALFTLLVVMVVTIVLVGWVGRRTPRSENREVKQLRALRDDLMVMAAEHAALGDPFAVLALDRINSNRKAIR